MNFLHNSTDTFAVIMIIMIVYINIYMDVDLKNFCQNKFFDIELLILI